ncbi:sensor histidine kinase [Verrucomicrobiota bacterium sgz303538]
MLSEPIKRLFRTVGVRMTLWHSAIFGIGAIVVFGIAYLLVSQAIDEQNMEGIEFRFRQFEAEYARGGRDAVVNLCKLRVGRVQKAFFVRLADRQNHTVFLRDPEDWSDFAPETLAAREYGSEFTWDSLSDSDGALLRIASERLGDGMLLQVGRTLENRRELLEGFRNALIVVGAVVLVAGIPAGAFVAVRALRPVQDLTATVHSILNTGKFTARVPSRGTGDEIDELVQCFNTMLEKIDILICGMRDSLDNVAHDLRTPMTRLRNVAITALDRDYDKARCHEAFGECLEESDRVLTMLFTLMDIAEAETGVMKLERKRVRVPVLVEQVVDLYQHVAEEKEIDLRPNVPPDLIVEGDAGRLQRALGNLVDNAIKYTPEHGRVDIRATRLGDSINIEVSDSGAGIPVEEQSRIWERLYRVDKSRSQRGLGLGLSFVKAIVEAHGGNVGVVSEQGRGSRFIVQLPR